MIIFIEGIHRKGSMLRRFLLICFITSSLAEVAVAQVFIQNTMYVHNRFIYNPAAAGTQNGTNATFMGRLQWLGIDGGPQTFTASINTPLERMQSGVGAYLIGDKLGPLSTLGVNVAYAYHFQLQPGNSESPILSIGAFGGVLQKSIDNDFRYDQTEGIDPVVPLTSNSTVVPNLGAGIYLVWPNDKLFFGLSGQDLLEPSLEGLLQTGSIGDDSKVSRSFYAMGGYRFDFRDDISIQPTFLGRTDLASYQLDLGVNATWRSLVTLGVAHRLFSTDSFSGILGFKATDNLFLGYAYDYTVSDLNANGDLSSHEIILSYTFRSTSKSKEPIDNVIYKR